MMPDLYLKSLHIRNIATFENQVINFTHGFNAIIGETGSGKSLILDSLQLIFGARADKKIIRKNSDFGMVEAVFHADSKDVKNWLMELGHPSESNEIVVKRIIYPNTPSKAWLNYQSCSLNLLTMFSRRYIDLVGQFENQKLLNPSYLLKLLDQFAGHSSQVNEFSKLFETLVSKKNQLQEFEEELKQNLQQEDFIRFQLKEIEELDPSIEDEKELILKKSSSLNLEKNQKIINLNQNRLSGDGDYSILSQLALMIKDLEGSDLLSADQLDNLANSHSLLSEVDYALGSMDFEPIGEDELGEILDRLDRYQKLKRKFGGSVEDIVKTYSELKNKTVGFDTIQKNISLLESEITKLSKALNAQAQSLHDTRTKSAKKLSELLTQSVSSLNMKGASLVLSTSKGELSTRGFSQLNFKAQTNVGEGFFDVQAIASGGELSRILLGLRQVLSSQDSISVFLFDEVDAGVGGETALKIGKSLSVVSKHSQVIAITHLPQIAVNAENLVHVQKETIGKDNLRTHSTVGVIASNDHKSFIQSMTPLN